MAQRRPPKHANVLALVGQHVDAGTYLDTRHAFARMAERRITLPEVLYVLRHGRHEPRKDAFSEAHGAWNYAIRGRTLDGRNLRVCVSFDPEGMLIITTIDLDAKN